MDPRFWRTNTVEGDGKSIFAANVFVEEAKTREAAATICDQHNRTINIMDKDRRKLLEALKTDLDKKYDEWSTASRAYSLAQSILVEDTTE